MIISNESLQQVLIPPHHSKHPNHQRKLNIFYYCAQLLTLPLSC